MGAGCSAGFAAANTNREGKLDAPGPRVFTTAPGVAATTAPGAAASAPSGSGEAAAPAGPRVFTAPKYVLAWSQLDRPQAAAIERFGLELKQGMSELRALLVSFLFNPANQEDDPPYGKGPLLYQEEAAAARQPVLDRLIRLKEQALPLIAQVDACTEQAYARVPGEPASIAAAQSGATQPIPECFEGGSHSAYVPKDKWSPEVSAVVVEAARMISSGEHEAEAVHVDAGDLCWLVRWCVKRRRSASGSVRWTTCWRSTW